MMIDSQEAMDVFIRDMESIEPMACEDYEEALMVALERVPSYDRLIGDGLVERRYFGVVDDIGVFFADSNPENTRWWPGHSVMEAWYSLKDEFGDDFVDGLPEWGS